jgi:hypothetical protein
VIVSHVVTVGLHASKAKLRANRDKNLSTISHPLIHTIDSGLWIDDIRADLAKK